MRNDSIVKSYQRKMNSDGIAVVKAGNEFVVCTAKKIYNRFSFTGTPVTSNPSAMAAHSNAKRAMKVVAKMLYTEDALTPWRSRRFKKSDRVFWKHEGRSGPVWIGTEGKKLEPLKKDEQGAYWYPRSYAVKIARALGLEFVEV